ncbi:hypothetical protein Acid7E03_32640 [Acidisoma sp. 7E03]
MGKAAVEAPDRQILRRLHHRAEIIGECHVPKSDRRMLGPARGGDDHPGIPHRPARRQARHKVARQKGAIDRQAEQPPRRRMRRTAPVHPGQDARERAAPVGVTIAEVRQAGRDRRQPLLRRGEREGRHLTLKPGQNVLQQRPAAEHEPRLGPPAHASSLTARENDGGNDVRECRHGRPRNARYPLHLPA